MLQAAGISEMMDSEIPNFEKVRELILWSQVYERIERAVDMVSDLGDTLEEVVLKVCLRSPCCLCSLSWWR